MPGEHVVAQRPGARRRRPLVVQRDARALLPGELAALERHLAGERAEQRRLAGAVRPGEREPVAALDLERDAVEERRARELLAEVRCDQDGHEPYSRSAAGSRADRGMIRGDEGRRRVRPSRRRPARGGARGARRPRGDRPRHPRRRASGSTTRTRRSEVGEAILGGRGRARRARLRLGRRRGDRRLQDRRHPRRDLPRPLQRAPGRRARRHERALPRLGDRRRRRSRASSSASSSPPASTAASATSRAWRRWRRWRGG